MWSWRYRKLPVRANALWPACHLRGQVASPNLYGDNWVGITSLLCWSFWAATCPHLNTLADAQLGHQRSLPGGRVRAAVLCSSCIRNGTPKSLWILLLDMHWYKTENYWIDLFWAVESGRCYTSKDSIHQSRTQYELRFCCMCQEDSAPSIAVWEHFWPSRISSWLPRHAKSRKHKYKNK